MQRSIAEFRSLGAAVVAVSSSSVDEHRAYADSIEVSFPILADPDGKVIRAWGLFHEGGLPLTDIPVSRPAVYIISPDGVVRRAFLTENWRVRLRPEQVLEALREAQAELAAKELSGNN